MVCGPFLCLTPGRSPEALERLSSSGTEASLRLDSKHLWYHLTMHSRSKWGFITKMIMMGFCRNKNDNDEDLQYQYVSILAIGYIDGYTDHHNEDDISQCTIRIADFYTSC